MKERSTHTISYSVLEHNSTKRNQKRALQCTITSLMYKMGSLKGHIYNTKQIAHHIYPFIAIAINNPKKSTVE